MGEEPEDELLLDQPLDDEPEHSQPEEPDFAIEIEGEEPAAEETPLSKHLRQQIRDRDRELAQYRQQAQPKIEVGQKPKLADFDYDEERFEAELDAYNDRKGKAERAAADQEEAARVRNQAFTRAHATYRGRAIALGVKDFDDAEASVRAVLPETVQSAIVQYMDAPERVVYALAKHPAKLAAVAAEADPLRQILMLRDMEKGIKVVNRAKPPAPEGDTIQRSTAPLSKPDTEREMARLEKEADRTGDRSKIIAYKAKLKEKAK